MTNFNFETREEYLAWRQDWKDKYANITEGIRNARRARKKYSWKYRTASDKTGRDHTVQKRTKIGSNPYYDENAAYRVELLKGAATAHLKTLAKAKKRAGKLREQRLLEEQYVT